MSRVVVPVAILEGESVPFGLMEVLATMDVTVLGYHVLPEQTPPDQARLQYEERATRALDDITEEFRRAGGAADHRLVFTRDREQSIDRVSEEVGAAAYAITGTTGTVERLLVPLTGDVSHDRVTRFVTELVGDRDIGLTLLLVADDEVAGRTTLESAAEPIADRGIQVRTVLVTDASPFEALIDALPEHDGIVMGEQAPSLASLLFGELPDRVAAESVGPVLVVRRPRAIDEG